MNAGLLVLLCLRLLEILLPCGFENLHVTLFPSLELLQWGYFYRTRYIGNQNTAADSHSRQQAPFCLKRHPFRHLNRHLFRCDSIAFSIHLDA